MGIEQHKHSEERINTNNGWGFGGWAGTQTTYKHGGVTITEDAGRWGHRHTGTSAHYRSDIEVNGVDYVSLIANKGDLQKAAGLLLVKANKQYSDPGLVAIPVKADGQAMYKPSNKAGVYTRSSCEISVYEDHANVLEVLGVYTWDNLREMENAPGLDMVVR